MSDNIGPLSDGSTVAAREVGGVKQQAVEVRDSSGNIIAPATAAAQTTGNASLSSIDGKITAVNTGAVTISAALPAGSNAIGKLAANSGIDIGDVDVTSVIPGTGATNLGKAIDSVAGATDTGVVFLGIRDDALSTLTPAEGDYVQARFDANGALHVTGAGGGTQYTEDAAAAADPVGTTPILVRKDTPSTTVSADGDNIAQRGTNYGAAYVTLLDTAGSPVAVGGGTQYTEDAAAAGDPIGTAQILVRKDTPSATVSADGDNIAQRGTNFGAAYVTLLDSSGNTVAVGGGTQYTEDAAAAGDPIGTVPILVRKDAPAAIASADGDNVAQRGSNFGAAYVTLLDIAGAPISGGGHSAAVSLTRTADTNAYAANDVIGSATGSTAALTFASMGPSAGRVQITSVSLEIDASAVISGETSYRLHLYNVTPPSALGDNAAFNLPSGDRSSYLGWIDLGTPENLGSTLYVNTDNVNKQVKLSGTSLFGYLVTVGAYTPTSARVHVVTLHAKAL